MSETAFPEVKDGVLTLEPHAIRFEDGRPVFPATPYDEWSQGEKEAHNAWFQWILRKDGLVLLDERQSLVDEQAEQVLRDCASQDLHLKDPFDAGIREHDRTLLAIDQLLFRSMDHLRRSGVTRPLTPLAWAVWARCDEVERRGDKLSLSAQTVAVRVANSQGLVARYNLASDAEKQELRQKLLQRGLIRSKG